MFSPHEGYRKTKTFRGKKLGVSFFKVFQSKDKTEEINLRLKITTNKAKVNFIFYYNFHNVCRDEFHVRINQR
jgi:hypothetical protein